MYVRLEINRVSCPLGHFYVLFLSPLVAIYSIALTQTIQDPPCTSDIVFTLLLCVMSWLWLWTEMCRWCAGVFAGVVGVHLCVLGVCYVITYPKPKPIQAQHLIYTLFRSA